MKLVDIMRSANFLPRDLEDGDVSPDSGFGSSYHTRFGNETEPLQRRSRQYALNAIRKSSPREVCICDGLPVSTPRLVLEAKIGQKHRQKTNFFSRPCCSPGCFPAASHRLVPSKED